MKSWKDAVVPLEMPIREVIARIDQTGFRIALVVDSHKKLSGVVTDGDVRRGLLKNISLDEPVAKIMKADPIVAGPESSAEQRALVVKDRKILQLPIVAPDGTVLGLEFAADFLSPDNEKRNWVVLMAGGHGKRLRPHTENTPKPLLTVGDKPILEHTIHNLQKMGFRNILISTFYLREQIQKHFGDGRRWGVQIQYLEEARELGTAGCLSLLPSRPKESFLVLNGDILTNLDFSNLLEFHQSRSSLATVCVRKYEIQVPYGVVSLSDFDLTGIEEKPIHSFFVSTGIYVFEPALLDHVKKDTYLDMPDLFRTLLRAGAPLSAFPLREQWLDIGRIEDLRLANQEFASDGALFSGVKK